MAKQSIPVPSSQSGRRSFRRESAKCSVSTPSSNCLSTSPRHLEPKDGLNVLAFASAVQRRVLIGKNATKEPSEACLVWALKNIIRPGDSVTILGILHRVSNPMGYKSQANLSAFVGTNKDALEAEMNDKLVSFEKSFRKLADWCDCQGIYLDITITAGTPLKSVLVKEATKMKVTHVLLDRHLRRDKRYYKENLHCCVVSFSEKNETEWVRESCSSHLIEDPAPPLPLAKSVASSTVPSSPQSAATSYTFNVNSFRISDVSSSKGESRASTQFSMGRVEDTSLRRLPNDETMPEDGADLAAWSEEHSGSSVGSNVRENSFIDLFMLSSPDGIMPGSASVNGNEISTSPGQVNSAEQAEVEAELSLSLTRVTASSVADAGCENCTTDSSLPVSYSSDQPPPVRSHEDIISVQPRRRLLPQLSEIFRSQERLADPDTCQNGAEGGLEDTLVPAVSKGEEAQLTQNTEVVVDAIEQKQVPCKSTNQTVDRDCGWRKHATEAPPLCSICKLTSLELGRSLKVYDWLELKAATNDFGDDNLIAEGGFSFVYKGILPEGQTVAIKKLKASNNQSYMQFFSEVEALSCAQHRNLVRLLGYGVGDEHALVYEYVCNGSLDQHLAGNIGGLLEWASRYKIAIGAARGLRYLHEECRVGCIVHRDLRPNNILITHDFVPLVGDFGLAKLNANVDETIETHVVGTLGFLAPEYVECGKLTSKTDVYSFGVVLLELISGRKAIELHRPKGETSLVEWARHKLQNYLIHELVDQRVADSLDVFELDRMVKAASLCINRDAQARPGMSQVLRILESDSYELPPIGILREIFPHGSNGVGYKSHNVEEARQSVDQFQMSHSSSKKMLAASKSWRYWVNSP